MSAFCLMVILTKKNLYFGKFTSLVLLSREIEPSRGAYSEPSHPSKMELFAKMVIGFQPITIFAKCSILDV